MYKIIGNAAMLFMLLATMRVAHAIPDVLRAGESLHPGEFIMSPNGNYWLSMQLDGKLAVWRKDVGLRYLMAETGTIATMQADGNFVQYAGDTPLWSTNTGNCCGGRSTMLVISDDGNLAVYQRYVYPNLAYSLIVWQIGPDPALVPNGDGRYPVEALSPPGLPPPSLPPKPVYHYFINMDVNKNLNPRY